MQCFRKLAVVMIIFSFNFVALLLFQEYDFVLINVVIVLMNISRRIFELGSKGHSALSCLNAIGWINGYSFIP